MNEDVGSVLEAANIEQMTEIARALKDLVASMGWKYYCNVVAAQKEARRQLVLLKPLDSMDGVLAQEYAKGEYQGFSVCEQLPTQLLEDLMNGIEAWKAANPEPKETEE
jgi:hypothetical protein